MCKCEIKKEAKICPVEEGQKFSEIRQWCPLRDCFLKLILTLYC